MRSRQDKRRGPASAVDDPTRQLAPSTVDLRSLSGFGPEILTSVDAEDLGWRLVRFLVERLAFPRAAFGRVDAVYGLYFRAGVGAGFDDEALWRADPSALSHPLGQGVAGRAAEQARSEIVDDLSREPLANPLPWLPARGSTLAVPIVRQGQVHGVVCVFSDEVGAFGDDEARQLEYLAPLVGVGLENALALSRLNGQNRQLTLVAEVSRIAVGAPDVRDLAARISAKLLTEFDAAWVGLSAIEPALGVLELSGSAQYPTAPPPACASWPLGEGLAGRVAQSGVTMVWDAQVEPDRSEALLSTSASELCVPLMSAGKPIGVLHLVSERDGRFRPDDAQVIEAVAGPVAHALANAQALTRITRLRNDLTGMIVHDVRNPLMIILTALKVLERVPSVLEDERAMRYLRSAGAAGDDIMRLVGSLLDIQKLEAGELSIHPVTFPVTSLVRRVVESNRIVAEVEQVRLRVEEDDETPAVCCDMDLMRRVVENLIGNAIKFTPAGGEVSVRIRVASAEVLEERAPELAAGVLVEVTDSGEGIPADQHTRIFEKFGVVESRKRRIKSSTGLGLALCKLVVSAHGGAIWVDSRLGAGSTFSFVAPAVSPSDGRDVKGRQ